MLTEGTVASLVSPDPISVAADSFARTPSQISTCHFAVSAEPDLAAMVIAALTAAALADSKAGFVVRRAELAESVLAAAVANFARWRMPRLTRTLIMRVQVFAWVTSHFGSGNGISAIFARLSSETESPQLSWQALSQSFLFRVPDPALQTDQRVQLTFTHPPVPPNDLAYCWLF